MAFELTREQADVVEDRSSRLTVRAAAGAGKTFVLVQRYLKHIERDGLRADQILTITFTRKAAAEMKGRIVKALLDAGLPDQAQIAETGPIMTIHSFCERLLRENALEAGLDPDFTVLAESRGARLLEQTILETIANPPEGCEEALRLIELLTGKVDFGGGSAPHAKLSAALKQALGSLRACGRPLESVRAEQTRGDSLLAYWEEALSLDMPEGVRAAFADFRRKMPAPAAVRAAYKGTQTALPPWAPRGDAEAKAWAAAEAACADRSAGLLQLACSAWEKLESAMRRLQALDFTMLESEAVRLVGGSEATREQIRRQYSVALVDEAQDLNPVQYRLLDSLGVDQEMLVGDAQQSIYGFRQAEVRLFQERTRTSDAKSLTRNHRSDAGILAFVDTLFSRIWAQDYAPMGAVPEKADFDAGPPSMEGVELWMLPAKDWTQVARWVASMRDEGERLKDIAVLVPTLQSGVECLARLEAEGVPARIVGGTERFYARLEIRDVANGLRALVDPYDDFSLLALLRSPMVGLSLDSIVLLSQEGPVIERLAEFSAPIEADGEAVRRFMKWFNPLSGYADRLSAWEAIAELIKRTSYLEQLARRRTGRQLIANVRKLLRLAAEEPEVGPAEFAEQIREIQQINHREGDAPATDEDQDMVTIMTVHKAKGLEFPVVVVPDLYRRLTRNMKDLAVDPWLATASTNYESAPSLIHKWLWERIKKREREEADRVLYVALTRAKRRLCLCVSPTPQPHNHAGLIARQLGLPDRGYPGLVLREPDGTLNP